MYATFMYELPPGTLNFHPQARQLLGRLSGAASTDCLDNQLFHRDDKGRCLCIRPEIRIGKLGPALRIDAISHAGVNLALRNAERITRLLLAEFGTVSERRRYGVCEIKVSDYLRRYRISSLVIKRSHVEKITGRYEQMPKEAQEDLSFFRDKPELETLVQNQVLRAIEDQCLLLQIDFPDLVIGDVEIQKIVPVHVKDKGYDYLLTTSFRLNATFIGPWAAGALQSRGYGRIQAVR